jgi:hypothetical protein
MDSESTHESCQKRTQQFSYLRKQAKFTQEVLVFDEKVQEHRASASSRLP